MSDSPSWRKALTAIAIFLVSDEARDLLKYAVTVLRKRYPDLFKGDQPEAEPKAPSPAPSTVPFRSPTEVAQWLGVSEEEVLAWHRAGELSGIELNPDTVRFSPAALHRFVERKERERTGNAEAQPVG